MNLVAPSNAPQNRRPHSWGNVTGWKQGAPVAASVEWLIDTGADVGVIQKQVGDLFDSVATGLSASPTTGNIGITMVTGIDVSFDVEDLTGVSQPMQSSTSVGVKSDNSGSNIIGQDQLVYVSARIDWDPSLRSGRLYQ
jgi:hypothetical protein